MTDIPHNAAIALDKPERKLPLGVNADGEVTAKAMPFAFILGTIAVFTLVPFGVLGVILHNMGMNRVQTAPESARKLVAWAWGIFAVTDTIALLGIVAILASR